MNLDKAIDGFNLYARTCYAKATADLFKQELEMVLRLIGNKDIKKISTNDLNTFMGFLKNDYVPSRIVQTGARLSASSQANYWKTLRAFFKWANENLDVKRPVLHLVRPTVVLPEVEPFTRE